MFQKLAVFQTAYAMAVHAGRQQAVVAQNVANVDTPGYVARTMPSFQEVYAPQQAGTNLQKATRAGHLHGMTSPGVTDISQKDRSYASPDGNTVSVDQELLRAVEAKRQHDRSLAIYGSALSVLRTSLGRQ